jgi:ubiquinone/menaquinone biosynthesis C-methylase UbiE
MGSQPILEEVRNFWEQGTCGWTLPELKDIPRATQPWFEQLEKLRYERESCIHSIAQFSRHKGKKILEIGVGAGTDHMQFAKAGAICHGVDLTDEAIRTTTERFRLYGFQSQLQRLNSEKLPFANEYMDLVYSWGVIHHSEEPQKIVNEIHRILKPGGEFRGMLYGRYSPHTFKMWVKFALLAGKPWRTFSDVIWHHVESIGTKSYTHAEVKKMYSAFSEVSVTSFITPYDTSHFPKWMHAFFPNGFGWFLGIVAKK